MQNSVAIAEVSLQRTMEAETPDIARKDCDSLVHLHEPVHGEPVLDQMVLHDSFLHEMFV